MNVVNKESVEEIYNSFFDIENDLNLFDEKIKNIFFWKLIRFKVLFKIFYQKNIIVDSKKKLKKNNSKFYRFISILKNSIFHSVFLDFKYKDILVFENPRKVKINSEFIDPFTYKFIADLSKTESSYQIIDLGDKGKHYNKYDDDRKYAESFIYDVIYKISKKIFKPTFNNKEKDLISTIQERFNSEFNVDFDLRNLIKSSIFEFEFQFKKYSKLFEIKKPKEIYIVCSYGKEGLIHAAQQQGIKVIEFQHGVMGKYHLGYSFPHGIQIPYFPNKILLFGQFWKDCTNLPLYQIDYEYIGFDYLISKLQRYMNTKKNKQVLVLSQPGNTDDLIPTTLNLCRENSDFSFIYRLHPKERMNWEETYPTLYKGCEELVNLSVDDGCFELYEQIASSEFVIGVNSAAVFEALMLDTKLIFVNSPGVEYMKYIIDSGSGILINSNDLIDLNEVKDINVIDDKNYFYRYQF